MVLFHGTSALRAAGRGAATGLGDRTLKPLARHAHSSERLSLHAPPFCHEPRSVEPAASLSCGAVSRHGLFVSPPSRTGRHPEHWGSSEQSLVGRSGPLRDGSAQVLQDGNGPYRQASPSASSARADVLDTEAALPTELVDHPSYRLNIKLPQYLWRAFAALIMAGQVLARVITGRIHWRNTVQQLNVVGPGSLGVSLLTACFVGMAFTIQFVKEFTRLGLTRSVGGVLALALARELSPVVTAIIMAGRVGSSFAAELGTMQVSEQTDTLRVLKTDPVDYLVTPRVLACSLALPVLTLICFSLGLAASIFLADGVFNVSANIILDSAARALQMRDMVSMMVKALVFGGIIADVSCAWGMTTQGGAKGVGESTTSAVVISLVCVFIADFALSWLFFQGGPGDSLKAAMG